MPHHQNPSEPDFDRLDPVARNDIKLLNTNVLRLAKKRPAEHQEFGG
jgi:hypothetical protein